MLRAQLLVWENRQGKETGPCIILIHLALPQPLRISIWHYAVSLSTLLRNPCQEIFIGSIWFSDLAFPGLNIVLQSAALHPSREPLWKRVTGWRLSFFFFWLACFLRARPVPACPAPARPVPCHKGPTKVPPSSALSGMPTLMRPSNPLVSISHLRRGRPLPTITLPQMAGSASTLAMVTIK